MNIDRALVECLPGLERDSRLVFQLHDDLVFEHIDERMGIVPMYRVLYARWIRYLNYAPLLARVAREIDPEQLLNGELVLLWVTAHVLERQDGD